MELFDEVPKCTANGLHPFELEGKFDRGGRPGDSFLYVSKKSAPVNSAEAVPFFSSFFKYSNR